MATSEKFNAVGGLSVNIPPIDIISNTGNITAPFANIGNIVAGQGVFGNITVSGNIVGNITGNVTGSISGNIRIPGADTQIVFNIGGNIATSPNLTFNPVTNGLEVIGNICVSNDICANTFTGNGANLTNVAALTAITVTGNLQPNITQLPNITDISISNTANIGNIRMLRVGGGQDGYTIVTDGNGNLRWRAGTSTVANGQTRISIPVQNGGINFSTANLANSMVIGNLGNVTINTELWVHGNVRAGVFDGNGSRLFDIPAANLVGAVPYTLNSNHANFANYSNYSGNVTISAQPNITSLGNLVSANVTGNLLANNLASNNLITIRSTVYGAESVTTTSLAPQRLWTHPASTITAGEFSIVGRNTVTGSRESVHLNVSTDGITASVVEYGRVSVGASLGLQTVTVNGSNLEIYVTPSVASSTAWTVNYSLV